MMKLEADLVRACGINTRNMQPLDVYHMGGRIIQSRLLFSYLKKYIPASGMMPEDARLRAIKDMNPADLERLRAEINRA
jgi:hypothetical protein